LARAYWSLADGRQTTVAILRSNELVGGTTLTGLAPSSFVQLLTASTLISLDLEAVRDLAASELEVATAISRVIAMRLLDAVQLIAVCSLGNIRQRVAYDLLNRASQSEFFVGRLDVKATQEELADSVGSSREVMSRALRGLRMEGIVETAPGIIRVLDPARLASIVRPFVI
jgi:CRP/FNR family transcriptional regulator